MRSSPPNLPLQAGWKPAEAADDVADDVRGHEESAVLAVSDERHPHHQDMEPHHGNSRVLEKEIIELQKVQCHSVVKLHCG